MESVVTMTKPHLSISQIEMYLRCGVQWEFRYVKEIVAPPGIAAIVGKSGHAAAARNFQHKMEAGGDLPARELMDYAAAAFDERIHTDDFTLSDDEKSRGAANVIGDAKDALVDSVRVFRQRAAPEYQPEAVEEGFRIELPGNRDLIGYVDLIHEGGVTDFKFRSRQGKPGDARKSIQLVAYGAAYRAQRGTWPKAVTIDTIANTATSVTRQADSTTVGERDCEQLASTINAVEKGIDAGVFLPAEVGSFWCSTKFCGYARMCPFFRGGE